MINIEIGDIIVLSNGQTMRVIMGREDVHFVCVNDWHVYLTLNQVDHIYQFCDDHEIFIEEIIKKSRVETVRVL